MPHDQRTFRVFISSTFSDLRAERNALQETVFPKLRQLCQQHNARFHAIDLRWGVSEQAAFDQQTMGICLEELARCQRVSPRPNFIVLLGERYGWQPLPARIAAEELDEILRVVTPEDRALLLWEDDRPGERDGWYRRDDNALPPAYELRAREAGVSGNASAEERSTALEAEGRRWGEIEARLSRILSSAVDRLNWVPGDPRRIRYQTSATHQEIMHGALSVNDAAGHVFCFFRRIPELSATGSSPSRAIGGAAGRGSHMPPEVADYVDVDSAGGLDRESHRKLESLKEQLRRALPGNVHEYEARWTGRGLSTDHIGQLCKDVYERLSRVILAELHGLEQANPLAKEVQDHLAFARQRSRFFTGRGRVLRWIADYTSSPATVPLALSGVPGSGKTALMGKALELASERHPGAVRVFRSIGATPDSANGRALLESLCQELARSYGRTELPTPSEYRDLARALTERLALATNAKPLLLFLDALDQLTDANNARGLTWLPTALPPNVWLIVSCSTAPPEVLAALRCKLPGVSFHDVEAMSSGEADVLLEHWLRDVGRKLRSDQRDLVVRRFAGNGTPLYLKLAFEEARRWKSHTRVVDLPADSRGMVRRLLDRLSVEALHGRAMVSRSLGYLAAAKRGLSEDEMLDVLSADEEVMRDFKRRSPKSPAVGRLPVVIWSRLFFDLEPYLSERMAESAIVMTFHHRQVAEVVEEQFLAGRAKIECHQRLARYFAGRTEAGAGALKERAALRALEELPYQQVLGGMWGDLHRTLTDFSLLEAKCSQGALDRAIPGQPRQFTGVYNLREDYRLALERLPDTDEFREAREDLREWADLIRLRTRLLTLWPEALSQEAYNSSDDRRLARAAEDHYARRQQAGLWFRLLKRPVLSDGYPLSQRFTSASQTDMVAVSSDGALVAASTEQGEVLAWDVASGRDLLYDKLSDERLAQLDLFANRFLLLRTGTGRLHIYDVRNGQLVLATGDDRAPVRKATTSEKGLVALALADGRTMVWDGPSQRQVASFLASPGAASLHLRRGKPSLLCCYDANEERRECRAEFWDLARGEQDLRLSVSSSEFAIADAAPDGECFYVHDRGSGKVLLHSLSSGQAVGSIGEKMAEPLQMTACGRYLLDREYRLFDTMRGSVLGRLSDCRGSSRWGPYWIDRSGRFVLGVIHDLSHQHPDVYVFDLASGGASGVFSHKKIEGPPSIVDSPSWLDISADGRWLALARHQDVEIYDLTWEKTYRQPGFRECVTAAAVVNDGRLALAGAWACNYGGGFKVYASGTGEQLDEDARVWVGDIHTTRNGAFFCVGWERGRSVGIWSGTGKHIASFDHGTEKVRQVAATEDGKRVITYSRHEGPGHLQVWAPGCKEPLARLPGYEGEDPRFLVSPNDQWLLTWVPAQPDFRVPLFQTHEDMDAEIARAFGKRIGPPPPDVSLRSKVILWDLSEGARIEEAEVARSRVNDVVMLPGSDLLATCGQAENAVMLWRLPSLEAAGRVALPGGEAQCLLAHPDGRRVFAGGTDRTWVVDMADGSVKAVWPVPCRGARTSRDGRHLVADGGDTLWLVEAATGKPLAVLCCPGKVCWTIGHPRKVIVGYASGGVGLYHIEGL